MQSMLNIAIQAATEAGKLITRYVDREDSIKVEQKGRNDFVTQVDRLAEQEVIYHLQKAYPDHSIIAEESGATTGNDYCWIIDPLDGTSNFMHGYPQFAVSIGLMHKEELMAGVVYDPLKQELFTALRGGGARLNNRRIRVSKAEKLSQALIGTGFPFRDNNDVDGYLTVFGNVIRASSGIRRAGAAALDLAYVACGRLDGFWESPLQVWDMAAGLLLIQEAGGTVTDFNGQQKCMSSRAVVAGNTFVQPALLELVQPK